MSPWEVGTTLSREQAINAIKEKAKAQGYNKTFKVTYDGRQVEAPSDLPDQVDMSKVIISSVLNNA
jgi:hypothetical protein